jgi:hypothetical protein
MDAFLIPVPKLDTELAKLDRHTSALARNAGRMEAELKVTRVELHALLQFVDEGWKRGTLQRIVDSIDGTLRLAAEATAAGEQP